jgi:septal ring factor EnvC (AmiA/AmiB activator)
MLLLLNPLLTFSQTDTSQNDDVYGDTLVYTPKLLMELLMADLEQCDLDRIELKKAKAELTLLYLDYAKKENAVKTLQNQLKEVREFNDTLVAQNLEMTIANQKEVKKLKRSKRFWTTTTFVGLLSAIGIHYNWKESWIDVK